MRRLTLAVTILASLACWTLPAWLFDGRGPWGLLSVLGTVPVCEICWRACDPIEERRDDGCSN